MSAPRLARFEVFPDVAGQWRWRLCAVNNEVICQSESYSRKRDAKRAVRSVRLAALTARVVEGTN